MRQNAGMDVRGSQRLSMAQSADADRMLGTSILLTMVTAAVLGVAGGTILVLIGPGAAVGVVMLLALGGAVAGIVAVQALHVWQLEHWHRWVLPVAADALLGALTFLTTPIFPLAALGIVFGVVVQSVGRVMARSAAMVNSWDVAVEDATVRYQRLVFGQPRGPWRSVSLEDAHPRVLSAGRDAFLELGGVPIPVGAADEQALMMAAEIRTAASRRMALADGDRAEDRAAVEAMVEVTERPRPAWTYTPGRIEGIAMAIAMVPVLVAVGVVAEPAFAVALFAAIGLRTAAWLAGRRLEQLPG